MSKRNTGARRVLFQDLPSIDELYQILDIKNIPYPRYIIKKTLRNTLASIRKYIQLWKIDKNIKQVCINKAKQNIDKLLSFNSLKFSCNTKSELISSAINQGYMEVIPSTLDMLTIKKSFSS